MQVLRPITEQEVWTHWQTVEGDPSPDFRSDIRGPLPKDMVWNVCRLQAGDIPRLYAISSSDWTDISGGTFRLAAVAGAAYAPSSHRDTDRIAGDIRAKIAYMRAGNVLDTHLIVVTDDLFQGPYTIIEGNRRGSALLAMDDLVGRVVYVGVSCAIRTYKFALCAYRRL